MNLVKTEYFRDLDKLITESIFVGNGIIDFESERRENMLTISISFEIAKECKVSDFLVFFKKLVENRKKQLEPYFNRRMIFYVWFDEQAAQLRFNCISAEHKIPPFDAEIQLVALDEIITDFLNSKYLEGIPLEGCSLLNHELEEQKTIDVILKIYYKLL